MRSFGSIGFLCLALGLFYGANHGLGLCIDPMDPLEASHRTKAFVLMAVSTVAGLIGLVIGQAIGASIPVRSDKADAVICCIWHFGEGLWDGIPGLVMVIHTFGNYARFHPHLHAIATDGLFRPSGTFYVLPKSDKQLEEISRSCILVMLKRKGKIADDLIQKLMKRCHSNQTG